MSGVRLFRNVAKFSFQGQFFSKIFKIFSFFLWKLFSKRVCVPCGLGVHTRELLLLSRRLCRNVYFWLKFWSKVRFSDFFKSKNFNQFLRSCKMLLLTFCCFWIRLINRFRSISPFGTAELSCAKGFWGIKSIWL